MRSKNLLIRNQEQTLLPAGDFLAFKKCARVWLEIWDFLTKRSKFQLNHVLIIFLDRKFNFPFQFGVHTGDFLQKSQFSDFED